MQSQTIGALRKVPDIWAPLGHLGLLGTFTSTAYFSEITANLPPVSSLHYVVPTQAILNPPKVKQDAPVTADAISMEVGSKF